MGGGQEKRPGPLAGTDELGAKRIQYLRRTRIRLILVTVLVLSAAVFTVWSIFFILTSEREAMRLSFLSQGSIDIVSPCSLVFLDDSVPVTAPGGGLLVPLVNEGERVGRGGKIALIVANDLEAEAIRYREARAEYQARLLLTSGFGDATRYPQALSPADGQLREAIAGVARSEAWAWDSGQSQAIREFRGFFLRARAEAALIAGRDPELDQLQAECSRLINLLEGDGRTLVLQSPQAGELAFSILNSSEAIEAVEGDPERVVDLLISAKYESRDLSYQRVEPGAKVASVSRFSGRSLAAWLAEPVEGDYEIRKGASLTVSPEAGGAVLGDCEVTSVEKVYDGILLHMSCEDWAGYRPERLAVKDASLVRSRVEGMRLPLSSLIDLDLERGSARLRTVKGGITKTSAVELKATDDLYAIIETVEPGASPLAATDLYVVNPWTTEDGVLID